MRYHNITKDDILNGAGLRVVLWLAGCEHNCPNCQNPITHDPDGGLEFTMAEYKEIQQQLRQDYISGVTFSGGDGLYPKWRKELELLLATIKMEFPNKTVWIYTGYRWEQVKHLSLMKYVDVLVDGRFVQELADVNFHYAGSINQRVLDVQKSLQLDQVVLYDTGYDSSKYDSSNCGVG